MTRDDLNWRDAKISFTLNGHDVPMASGTTANLIHGIPEQIAAISSFATLLPGDVILTGTPNASGHLDPGDEAIVHVEGIGSLRNVVLGARCFFAGLRRVFTGFSRFGFAGLREL